MTQGNIFHQNDCIIIPRKNVIFHQIGTDHRVCIKVRDMESLNNIIEQCEAIRLNMWKEKVDSAVSLFSEGV